MTITFKCYSTTYDIHFYWCIYIIDDGCLCYNDGRDGMLLYPSSFYVSVFDLPLVDLGRWMASLSLLVAFRYKCETVVCEAGDNVRAPWPMSAKNCSCNCLYARLWMDALSELRRTMSSSCLKWTTSYETILRASMIMSWILSSKAASLSFGRMKRLDWVPTVFFFYRGWLKSSTLKVALKGREMDSALVPERSWVLIAAHRSPRARLVCG